LPVRDLAEFHIRWSEFRPLAEALLSPGRLTRDESEVLRWLILLADRIGERDLR
jgi:hypothetical protein